jgi:murein endopeptidase
MSAANASSGGKRCVTPIRAVEDHRTHLSIRLRAGQRAMIERERQRQDPVRPGKGRVTGFAFRDPYWQRLKGG